MVVLGCVVAFPVGGGAPCPGLAGWVVARGWSSGCVGDPRAVSRSSYWRVSVRGPCGIVVAWGPGSPWAGCVGLECRNQGGVVAWCLGVPVVWGAPCMGHARATAFAGSAVRWVAASWACCGPGAALRVVSGGVWLWCIVSTWGGGYVLGCGVGPW